MEVTLYVLSRSEGEEGDCELASTQLRYDYIARLSYQNDETLQDISLQPVGHIYLILRLSDGNQGGQFVQILSSF